VLFHSEFPERLENVRSYFFFRTGGLLTGAAAAAGQPSILLFSVSKVSMNGSLANELATPSNWISVPSGALLGNGLSKFSVTAGVSSLPIASTTEVGLAAGF